MAEREFSEAREDFAVLQEDYEDGLYFERLLHIFLNLNFIHNYKEAELIFFKIKQIL